MFFENRMVFGAKSGTFGPDALGWVRGLSACWWGNGLPRHMTGSWSERMDSHTGTETLPRLLREAAVENLYQWTKV
jgi:hypothetical protein